jgi:hypothetical protein
MEIVGLMEVKGMSGCSILRERLRETRHQFSFSQKYLENEKADFS